MIHINIYAKFGQISTFHVFAKKVEKSHFFSFFGSQNRCHTKNFNFVEKIQRFFFFNFQNRFLTPFCLKWKKLQKNLKKMIHINFYAKHGQNSTFHVFEKKVEKSNFFSFFRTQNRCLTKNVSFVEKILRFLIFNF